jgi:hypothetical protein
VNTRTLLDHSRVSFILIQHTTESSARLKERRGPLRSCRLAGASRRTTYAAACLLAGSDVKLSTVAAEIGIVRAVAMARGDDSARENQLPSAGTFFDVLCRE